MHRRTLLNRLAAAAAVTLLAPGALATAATRMTVYRNPNCGCCGAWIKLARSAGFKVEVVELDDPGEVRRRHGMADEHGSCHTALVDGYVIEGHVPIAELKRLLAERPQALGLAVPGMPLGSPGMEAGGRRDAFEVLLVQRDGSHRAFARYEAQAPA